MLPLCKTRPSHYWLSLHVTVYKAFAFLGRRLCRQITKWNRNYIKSLLWWWELNFQWRPWEELTMAPGLIIVITLSEMKGRLIFCHSEHWGGQELCLCAQARPFIIPSDNCPVRPLTHPKVVNAESKLQQSSLWSVLLDMCLVTVHLKVLCLFWISKLPTASCPLPWDSAEDVCSYRLSRIHLLQNKMFHQLISEVWSFLSMGLPG